MYRLVPASTGPEDVLVTLDQVATTPERLKFIDLHGSTSLLQLSSSPNSCNCFDYYSLTISSV